MGPIHLNLKDVHLKYFWPLVERAFLDGVLIFFFIIKVDLAGRFERVNNW